MRNSCYGDNRDVVKWAVLLNLAQKHRLRAIVQICFLAPYDLPSILVNGDSWPVPEEVIRQFRTPRSVENISQTLTVSVFDEPFRDRQEYRSAALTFVDRFHGLIRAVFLDPITGLSPRGALNSAALNSAHMTEADLQAFWSILRSGELLVISQHRSTGIASSWIDTKQQQLADAIDVCCCEVKVARAKSIANDLVLFFVRKP